MKLFRVKSLYYINYHFDEFVNCSSLFQYGSYGVNVQFLPCSTLKLFFCLFFIDFNFT